MTERQIAALAQLMDRFAREHWDDSFSPERGTLAVDGDTLRLTRNGHTVEGQAGAPLLFVTGAWALIFAEESDGRYGHRIDGHLNRVWPNGVRARIDDHRLGEAIAAFAALWPETIFSSSLYRDVKTPGYPRSPRAREDAPSSTTLTGILKRVAQSADDADPLERMKTAEFIEHAVRQEWSMTAEDAMMKAVGAPLLALARDSEPATRELALLALETCADRCWYQRAYGLYEPLCELLIEAGLNAHLQYMRLAESAFAHGELEQAEHFWALAINGQNPGRAMKLGAAYDALGDWSDLRTKILRQAGGANWSWSYGGDPNPARMHKLNKKPLVPPKVEKAATYRERAKTMLAMAAEGADKRLAIDLAAIRTNGTIALGAGQFDPSKRRLFLHDIFLLQAQIASAEGDIDDHLRLTFKALDTHWQTEGSNPAWRSGLDDQVLELIRTRDDADLQRLGLPAYMQPLLADARKAHAMTSSEDGREQLFWQGVMGALREEFLRRTDLNGDPLPGEDLISGFSVTRDGGTMAIAHPGLAEPVRGPLSTPVLNGLRAWNRTLQAVHGVSAIYEASSYKILTFNADGVAVLARIAEETLATGARDEAIALFRFAHGADPLVKPWPYNDPVAPLPIADVPEDLRDAVAATSPLEAEGGHPKVKPRGRRVEALAEDFATADAVTARVIGHFLREAAAGNESEIDRVIKAGAPVLLAMWEHADPQVREMALIATEAFLGMQGRYSDHCDKGLPLIAHIEAADITDMERIAERWTRKPLDVDAWR